MKMSENKINKRDVLLWEVSKMDMIEEKVKAICENVAYNPKLVDILMAKGSAEYKSAVMAEIIKSVVVLVDNSIELGNNTAIKLRT
jgi:hypothetical protein